jgi:REP-associated tyrosine transposase
MIYLFVHVIWRVGGRECLLSSPVRRVLFAHLQKEGEIRGIRLVAAGGAEDHVHCLFQLLASQNLAQVVRSIRTSAADWLNETRLLTGEFGWEEDYFACSVSPSGVRQVIDYLGRQEEYHKTRTLDNELEIFDRFNY